MSIVWTALRLVIGLTQADQLIGQPMMFQLIEFCREQLYQVAHEILQETGVTHEEPNETRGPTTIRLGSDTEPICKVMCHHFIWTILMLYFVRFSVSGESFEALLRPNELLDKAMPRTCDGMQARELAGAVLIQPTRVNVFLNVL